MDLLGSIKEQRGSDKIRAAFRRGGKIEESDLQWLKDYLKREDSGARLLTFWIRGQPHPDSMAGTLIVEKEKVGAMMQAFTEQSLPLRVSTYTPGRPNQATVMIGFSGPLIAWQGGQPAVNVLETLQPDAPESGS